MLNATFTTLPVSYSKACDTFGATDCAAARACLGRSMLAHFDVLRSVLESLVAELRSKLRPAGIENGFRHLCLGEPGCAHVAHNDELVFTHEPAGLDVVEMLAGVL